MLFSSQAFHYIPQVACTITNIYTFDYDLFAISVIIVWYIKLLKFDDVFGGIKSSKYVSITSKYSIGFIKFYIRIINYHNFLFSLKTYKSKKNFFNSIEIDIFKSGISFPYKTTFKHFYLFRNIGT